MPDRWWAPFRVRGGIASFACLNFSRGSASGLCPAVAQICNVDVCQGLIGFEDALGEVRSVLLEREHDRMMPEEPAPTSMPASFARL